MSAPVGLEGGTHVVPRRGQLVGGVVHDRWRRRQLQVFERPLGLGVRRQADLGPYRVERRRHDVSLAVRRAAGIGADHDVREAAPFGGQVAAELGGVADHDVGPPPLDEAGEVVDDIAGQRTGGTRGPGRARTGPVPGGMAPSSGKRTGRSDVSHDAPTAWWSLNPAGATSARSDTANPDNYPHFYSDLQMFTTTMTQPDPELFMMQFASWEVAAKDNKWQGRNITRWKNEEYDKLFRASETSSIRSSAPRSSSR